jgi:hypothetical protein
VAFKVYPLSKQGKKKMMQKVKLFHRLYGDERGSLTPAYLSGIHPRLFVNPLKRKALVDFIVAYCKQVKFRLTN